MFFVSNHEVSLIHLSCTLLLRMLCFATRHICETKVGEVIFPCLLSTIVVFTHLLICWLFIHSIGFHQTTKLCFNISYFLFILEGVLCKWRKTLKRLPRQLCYLLFKLKTLNYHILLIVAKFRI